MSRTLLLGYDETRTALEPDALLSAVRTALIATGQQQASTPARIAAFAPAGLLGAMPGFVPGLGLAGKLTSVFAVKGADGRSTHGGIVALFDETDGRLRAIVNGAAVTAARTAAGATVAFGALARPDVARIAVIGAGTQARAQLDLLAHLRTPGQIVVASRDPHVAAELAEQYGVRAAGTIRAAVSGADAVFCCTNADQPVVQHAWLQPHAYVSSIGGSRGPELDHLTVTSGALFVEWPGAVTCPPPAGAHELQGVQADHATLIGTVLADDSPAPADELTVYKSTGYAALDVAAAATAFETATTLGLGTWVEL